MPSMQRFLESVLKTLRSATRTAQRRTTGRTQQSSRTGGDRYAGDFEGTPRISYEPVQDDLPDPGEIVWAWVPYEEDHSQGKDRPVLVIGRDGDLLLALQLSSQDHDKDAADEARWGRYWVDVGAGAWDRERRPSEARVDRILRIDPAAVRRIGAVLDRERFDEVAAGVRQHT
ncbi:type II toxin-antitoxin system PemK/MazF family toxin [Ornithinimicrobium sp. F0845]|uniref:type II toxin-antitoxin system PemK/MazF family toxin n=1 Tax=Ornithinimicrobium sp. F0845 TaxID=2926412 RepID=UPI001FF55185|nr:type II toxin-antitoxin system PemK/MazF family toxin [Ornithinimicrobium sp. F0845]MCK0111205.1 type II toxin-antitoxin system PemK/MazF family toxin [Ornithinimicrobium sp. F0845]